MRQALLTAGAVLLLTGPALAQGSVTIEKKTITKEVPARAACGRLAGMTAARFRPLPAVFPMLTSRSPVAAYIR